VSIKYHDLMNLTDKELIELYDKTTEHTSVGLNYYTEEIARRRTEKSDNLMIKLTKWIVAMTLIMLLSTIANVIIAVVK